MTNTIINGKKYSVSKNLNDMEYNFIFTDKNNIEHLVDGYDAQEWAEENNIKWDSINTAVKYAKEKASESEDGIFWWKVKE